mmetsp:Transcript_38801/g.77296  ORF Transcript_38801/g.77296 Transcript_38801/m.77296 type:complete len:279 (+) Transcript_38801:365-1201(+)
MLCADETESDTPVLNVPNAERKKSTTAANKPAGEGKKTPYVMRRTCRKCHLVGHLQRNCPEKDKTASVLLAAESDEDALYSAAFMMYESECVDDKRVLITDSEVVWDCAAGQSIFKNQTLLSNMRTTVTPRLIGWVDASSGSLVIDREGEFGDLVTVGYSAGADANLLSQSQVLDRGADVEYVKHQDKYIVRGAQHVLESVRKSTPHGKSRLVTTVAENSMQLTTRDRQYSLKADILLRRLGHMSERAGMSLLNAVVNALALHGLHRWQMAACYSANG